MGSSLGFMVTSSKSCTWFTGAFLLLLFSSTITTTCTANNLQPSSFYDKTCPQALLTIQQTIKKAVSRERRMAASLIRLHFHDCFVQGCDASILLKNSSTIRTEEDALQNRNSIRGFEVIDEAKSLLEKKCAGVVSCADILAVAARDASVAVGGPSWNVKLGRRDSTTANLAEAQRDLPLTNLSVSGLISNFAKKGLNKRDMVALSGSHTIGRARCTTFRSRIYNDSNIDGNFARLRQSGCPSSRGDNNLADLDLVTPNNFDNNYFKNLLKEKGLLASDQILFSGGQTDNIVTEYTKNTNTFSNDFALAMVKMGDIEPLLGSAGQIRKTCRAVN
ncbi:peroxidase P7-like [Humulus lupulus]|uniref:peroxidase P7-like n=1 Tax=Humulus lupulus TaxID=3486 RepID=UPI002B402097|nr:peroxidase P7-like [Humulus lupulus]